MKILVLHGPNLNMLGKRNKEHYGDFTLDHLYETLSDYFPMIEFTYYQSNYEGELLEVIHESMDEPYQALIINPGPLTHTSIALRDALEMIPYPKIEVHLSDINQREEFRKIDLIKDVCEQRFMGNKLDSYIEAINYLLRTSKKVN
jgi:3-dehydroquinate dehydratase-2